MFYLNVCDWIILALACALRWGVAPVGVYPTRHCSPRRGTPFQVQGVCRWTTRTRGRSYEESWVVAYNSFFEKKLGTN